MALKADITIDIDKQVGNLQNLTNIYNARVGDNNTPLTVLWQKNGIALNLKGLHAFIAGKVGDGSYNSETDKVDFPVGTPVVKYEDDGSGTLDNGQSGLTTLLIPKQMWSKTGLFAGYIGLKDENGSVFTSKDIFFKVLGNVLDAGVAINYFISDFDEALAKAEKELKDKTTSFDQTANKALQDLKNKYDQEVAAHEGALIDDESQLRKLANAIDIINSNLEANNVITRPDFEKQNQRIDDTLSKMNLNVESYPELNDVKAKYPTGSSNLIITEDGYRAVWDGKDWVKGSAFVAAPLGNKAVAPTNVSNISFKQVSDNALNLNSIKPWSGVGPTYTVNEDHTIDLTADGSDNGLLFTADSSSLNDDFYINLDVKPLSNQNTQTIDLYLMYPDGRLGKELCSQLSNSEFNQSYELLKVDLKEYIIDNTFTLLLATHAKDITKISLNISNRSSLTTLSDVANKVTCPDMLKTSTLNVKKWQKWNWGAPTDNILVNNAEGLFFRQNALGDLGICSEQKINPESDVYVTLTELSNAWFSVYFVKDLSQITFPNAELTSQYPSLTSPNCYKTFVFKIPKSQIEMQGIKNKATVLIVLHGKDSLIQIKDFSISNSPGSSLVTEKTGQLYKQAGMNFSTQIGNVDLLQVPSSSNGVHYICSKFVSDKDNQVVSQIDVVTKSPGTVNFAVGTIDQNQLLVNETVYSYKVSSTGLNSIPVNIPLNSGQTLLMDISNGIAQLYQPTQVADEVLIQDESHLSKVPGYSGMIFYSMDLALPYQFTVQSKPFDERIQKNEQDINSIEEKTKDLTAKVEKIDNRKLVLNDDNGVQYKLMIVDGKLMAAKSIPENVVIIGNSLTSNTGLIGMNASDADHDYYHYVTEYIKSKNPNVKINPRTNVSSWESVDTTPPTADREKVFNDTIKPLLSADTDLVIIQLGDNVNNPVRESTLANDAQDLIKEIKAISPMAKIMWVYGWFGDATAVDLPIQQACDAEKVTGINIADLNTKDNQGTMGSTFTGLDGKTYTVTDPGVAAHPGDKGHKAISDRIISNFDF